MDDNGRLMYGVDDAAKLLSLGRTKVFEAIRDGELKAVKVGRARRLIPRTALVEYVDSLMDAAHTVGDPR